jgi:hypothetical protein
MYRFVIYVKLYQGTQNGMHVCACRIDSPDANEAWVRVHTACTDGLLFRGVVA